MFYQLSLGLAAVMALTIPSVSAAQDVSKENIESGTTAFRLVRYTRPNSQFTCTAMVCEKRNAKRCGTKDGLITISNRTEGGGVYLSYYPPERQASRKLKTRIKIGSFRSRSFLPIQDYPETWIVPNTTLNSDMLYELERADRTGPIEITVKTDTFAQKRITMRDLEGMKDAVLRICR